MCAEARVAAAGESARGVDGEPRQGPAGGLQRARGVRGRQQCTGVHFGVRRESGPTGPRRWRGPGVCPRAGAGGGADVGREKRVGGQRLKMQPVRLAGVNPGCGMLAGGVGVWTGRAGPRDRLTRAGRPGGPKSRAAAVAELVGFRAGTGPGGSRRVESTGRWRRVGIGAVQDAGRSATGESTAAGRAYR